jgi:GT2 family glycosyltransferase
MSSIAAIVPSWNTARHLGRCLDSLAAQADVSIDVLVVENGSDDASLELIERRGAAHVALPTNVGFAKAVNLGVSKTRAPLLLVLNADCFLARDAVALLAAEMSRDAGLGGVQPRIVQEDDDGRVSRIYSVGQGLTRSGSAFERGWGEPDGACFEAREEVFGVSGAACLLRRELFTELGGYDESYFAFYEDVDLNARARLAGWRFAYVPAARAIHVGHAAWSQATRAQRFNVGLTVRNRLATAVKTLPLRGVAGSLWLTLRSVLAGPPRGSGVAALAGALTALRWMPRLLRDRRRLRSAPTSGLDDWLAAPPGAGPDPRQVRAAT